MMLIDEVLKRCNAPGAYKDSSVAIDLARLVKVRLEELPPGTTEGTGSLINRLMPTHTEGQYNALVSALALVRRVPTAAKLWEYTGKKTRFGKPALRWIAQSTTKAVPESTRNPDAWRGQPWAAQLSPEALARAEAVVAEDWWNDARDNFERQAAAFISTSDSDELDDILGPTPQDGTGEVSQRDSGAETVPDRDRTI
jgi:hypothetical protein